MASISELLKARGKNERNRRDFIAKNAIKQ